MSAHEHLNKILFHASTSVKPPHKKSKKSPNTFHVGTIGSAIDRVSLNSFTDDALSEYDDESIPQVDGFMHVYDVQVPKNMHTYDDPHASGYDEYSQDDWDSENAIDESSVKDIAAYLNRHEDPGSTSYIINKNMLKNKKIKYVGTMPFTARAEAGDEKRIMKELGYE